MLSYAIQVLGVTMGLVVSGVSADIIQESADIQLDFANGDSALQIDGAESTGESATPLLAMLQDETGEYGPYDGAWEFILSGTGTSDQDFDSNSFGATFSIGYFFTEAIEVALRQSFFVASNGDTVFNGTTRIAGDFHFDLDAWRPFIGGSFGATYGDNIDDTWLAGLEGGVKWYVKQETFIFAMVEWLWFFDDAGDVGDAFDDGQWVYTLGIGFNF